MDFELASGSTGDQQVASTAVMSVIQDKVKLFQPLHMGNTEVIKGDGKWAGDSTGLKGDKGAKGSKGMKGTKGA